MIVERGGCVLEIKSNGTDWNAPVQPIHTLLKKLDQKPLDPVYEGMGNFIIKYKTEKQTDNPRYVGCTHFLGHFATIPYVFNVITDERVIIEELTKAIRINQERLDYEQLRKNIFSY
jgi:hypothetical protein